MEKICTRCNFKTPASRKVCQVCGFAKFAATPSVEAAVAKQGAIPLQAAFNAVTKLIKEGCSKLELAAAKDDLRSVAPVVQTATVRPQEVFKDGDDLDSMIAWFKSYGVDRPLILEPATQQHRDEDNYRAA